MMQHWRRNLMVAGLVSVTASALLAIPLFSPGPVPIPDTSTGADEDPPDCDPVMAGPVAPAAGDIARIRLPKVLEVRKP